MNYLENKLLKLGYPRNVAKEGGTNPHWLREERITERELRKKKEEKCTNPI
ncbi:MAG: hypothetical protein WC389_10365 [Lutibacter sp.]|jgi:hypothetical protein